MVVLDFTPPGPFQLKKVLRELLSAPNVKCKLTKHDYETMINASLGLTSNQAQRVFSKAIVSNGILDIRDIDMIKHEKKSIIRQSDALELYTTTDTIADVGGVDVLKNWLKMRERAFSKEAKEYGLPSPKGIALIGIPGTGKS